MKPRKFLLFPALLCAFLFLLILFLGTALATLSSEWSHTIVVSNSSDQVNAAVSGQTVVWQDYRNTTTGCPSVNNCTAADIYARTLPGAEERLTTTPNGMDPDVSGNLAVWRNWDTGKIIVHNLTTGAEQNASSVGGAIQQVTPAISGNKVVWVDYRDSAATGFDYGEIYMKDLTTGVEQAVTTETDPTLVDPKRDKKNPEIDGNIVVWEDMRNAFQDAQGWWHNPDIYMKDLTTGVVSPVCTNTADQYAPVVSGNKVAWMDYRNGNWDVYMKDLTNNVETRMTTGPNDNSWPAISGDLIAYKTSPKFSSLGDIVLKRISNGAVTQVTSDTPAQKLPAMSGAAVVWLDQTPGNWDIYRIDDVVAPQISGLTPSGNTNTVPTMVSAAYSDSGSGVDRSTVSMTMDGTALTGCVATDTVVNCPVAGVAQGSHALAVSVSDLAGNAGTGSASFYLDSMPPSISNITPTGWLTSGSATIGADYSDSGSGVAASSVTVQLDGSAVGGCTAAASHVTCAASGLADGHHSVVVNATDNAGNTATLGGSFDIDTTAPAINLSAAYDDTTKNIDINADLSDPAPGSGVDAGSVQVWLNGAALPGCSVSAASVSCQSAPATAGTYSVLVSAGDAVGNTGTAGADVKVTDTVAPAVGPVTFAAGAGGVASSTVISASWSDPAPASGINTGSASVKVDGAPVSGCIVNAAGVSCSTGPGLGVGTHTAAVAVSDNAGNTGTAAADLVVTDAVAPVITIIGPEGTIPGPSTTLSATYADAAPSSGINTGAVAVTLDGSAVSGCIVTATGVSCATGNLTDGSHNVTVAVADNAGNPASANWSFSVSPGSPIISNLAPAAGSSVNNGTPALSADYWDGHGIDATTVKIDVDGNSLTNDATITTAGVSAGVPYALKLAPGVHHAHISVSDLDGNTAEQTWQFTVTAPQLSLATTRIYWNSYADYLQGHLSVDYRISNPGTGKSDSTQLVYAVATNGVLSIDALPLDLGDIASGTYRDYTQVYLVPTGVSRFVATDFTGCMDDGGNVFWFPGPPPIM